ncbi:DUF6083 domain-containing protein [Streptomyces sp. NBC_01216]|uniref:DUF6083 domain-containing protein n=1 Tax=unclassified Streptomyces TaxID=2593676 RepID=UPI002E11DBCF|nr:DUF6083 domain-containing protein [Streptomyces sp. NBC_01216]
MANALAEDEGATAAPWPDPDAEDMRWIEPATCRRCGGALRVVPTDYDRWIGLSATELPVDDVPPRFRWRLVWTAGGLVAVRPRGADALRGGPVFPDHRMVCPAEDASAGP